MRKVLIFKETLLPPSETFILAQMKALTEYQPLLAGLEPAHPSLSLPHEPILLSPKRSSFSDVRAKLYRRMGTAPLFHRKARRSRPELIHAHFASGGRSALPLARSLGVPLLVTFHGSDVTVRGQQKDLYRQLAEQATLFVCVSQFIRNAALKAGFPAEKLIVHYIGIDREAFSPSTKNEAPRGVLFVGRLVEKKGCEYLLRAMQRVQNTHPECRLTIIGDGPLRPQLEALAKELNVFCEFLGVRSSAAIRDALQVAKVFCVPSVTAADGDSEGLAIVFAEAQAMGVPVVSTVHGGIPELVIHGSTGLLAPERDAQGLADAISLLLADDELWQKFHRAGPENVEQRFDLRRQTALLEDIYKGVAATRDSKPFVLPTSLHAANVNQAAMVNGVESLFHP
jgi:glycosyltransferase involved in cell wall biosynthesis